MLAQPVTRCFSVRLGKTKVMNTGNEREAYVQGNFALFQAAMFSLVKDEEAFQTDPAAPDNTQLVLPHIRRLDPAPERQALPVPRSPLSPDTGFLIFTHSLNARNQANSSRSRNSFTSGTHSLWSAWPGSNSLQALHAVSQYRR